MKTLFLAIYTAMVLTPATYNESGHSEKADIHTNTKSEHMTYPAKHISISINRSADDVYQFASDPENFPRWVEFIESITPQGDSWIAETAIGRIKIKFTPTNDFGIIDHQVTLGNGEIVNNPMRAVANKDGCEFIFTLFWMPGRTEQDFTEDAAAVTGDLQRLKKILEAR